MHPEPSLELISRQASARPNFPATLAGIWRLTWKSQLTWKKIYGILANVLGLPILCFFAFGGLASKPFYLFTVDFYLLLALPILCLTAFGSMVRDELQEDTVCFLLTRPVKRWQFFISKYLCHLLWTQITVVLTLTAFAVAGALRNVPQIFDLMLTLLIIQFPATMAYGAISSLMGLMTRKYLVLGLIYGFVVEFGIGQIPTNINTLAMTNHLKSLMAHFGPLAEYLNRDPGNIATALTALVITSLIFAGISAFVFNIREYSTSDEMAR
ncbi:MAG: ABC transporter permease [Verrucomicrobiota bacterium]|nr:ABC transporter permease [Verrucomicrobiota bacterium]